MYNVLRLALSGVEPTPSHYKYNKTFHSAADFPQENPEVAIEANRCYAQCFFLVYANIEICPSFIGDISLIKQSHKSSVKLNLYFSFKVSSCF